jgi:hypothetical protein
MGIILAVTTFILIISQAVNHVSWLKIINVSGTISVPIVTALMTFKVF